MSDEKQDGVIFTPKVEDDMGTIDEFPVTNEEEINVKSVLTPEELKELLPKDVELLEETITDGKPISGVEDGLPEEKKELTEEEKRALKIQQLKESHIRFHPIGHASKKVVVGKKSVKYGSREIERELKSSVTLTNITTNQFDKDYRKKRQKKNRMARASRKANR
jgi:hypothetical protein